MRRREFITLLGGAAAAWPLAARAQQSGAARRIGVLIPGLESDPALQAYVAAFRQGLARLAWSEGRNLRIDFRFSAGRADQFPVLAKEVVALQPDAIVVNPDLSRSRCNRRPAQSRSCSPPSLTQSARAWLRVCRGPAETSPASC